MNTLLCQNPKMADAETLYMQPITVFSAPNAGKSTGQRRLGLGPQTIHVQGPDVHRNGTQNRKRQKPERDAEVPNNSVRRARTATGDATANRGVRRGVRQKHVDCLWQLRRPRNSHLPDHGQNCKTGLVPQSTVSAVCRAERGTRGARNDDEKYCGVSRRVAGERKESIYVEENKVYYVF